MNLRQLQYFVATCRHGSFSAAADALYLSQPSLAEQVRRLEEELGAKLFVRSWRRLELTEAGRTLLPHAENVLSSVETARASVLDVRDVRGGVASFGTFGLAYRYFLSEIVAEFAARHPEVVIRVVGQNSVQVCEQVRDGKLEAGLVTLPIDETGLDVESVMTEELVFLERGRPEDRKAVSIEHLAEARLILYDAQFGWSDPLRRLLAARASEADLRVEPAIEVESFDAALGLVTKGVGSTVSMASITERADFPGFVDVSKFDPPLTQDFAFIRRPGEKLSRATEEFVRLARRQVEQASAQLSALRSRPTED